jgi:hypothetical protein
MSDVRKLTSQVHFPNLAPAFTASTHSLRYWRFVLLVVFAFDFEDEGFAVFEFYEEVWVVLMDDAAENVVDHEAEVVVFCPGNDFRIMIQFKSFCHFPGAVDDDLADVAFLCVFAWSAGEPSHHAFGDF